MIKKTLTLFLLTFVMALKVWSQSDGYVNPILRGMNPDPSICKVGEDYYLISSTITYYPGIPIYHSKDLVNWKLIGHCLTKASHFCLDKNKNAPVIYAATLRHHNGTFYMVTTDVAGGGNYYLTATNPAGPWSDPIFVDQPVFDPSLFFDDDGKVYYTRRGDFKDKDVVQAEIDPKTGKLLTPLKSISKGLVSEDTEGPHLFKANGWYYLTMGEGGSRFLHMQTIARSKSPWGPFEPCPNNPVISQHNAWWHPIKSLGHADFVQAPDGSWWAVALATRHADYGAFSAIGRETFLLPVEWVNDWPVVKPEYTQKLEVKAKTLPLKPWPAEPTKDDFSAKELGLKWTLLAYPFEKLYNLSERPGYLRLKGGKEPLYENKQVAFVGCRQKEMAGECITSMEFAPTNEKEEAGITVFQSGNYHYDLFRTVRGGKQVVILRKKVGDMVVESSPIPVSEKVIALKISLDPTLYHFYVQEKGGEWKEVGTGICDLIASEVADVWSGTFIGMYSTGNGSACKNPADFDWFDANFTFHKIAGF